MIRRREGRKEGREKGKSDEDQKDIDSFFIFF
jgi:hypothetical protein